MLQDHTTDELDAIYELAMYIEETLAEYQARGSAVFDEIAGAINNSSLKRQPEITGDQISQTIKDDAQFIWSAEAYDRATDEEIKNAEQDAGWAIRWRYTRT